MGETLFGYGDKNFLSRATACAKRLKESASTCDANKELKKNSVVEGWVAKGGWRNKKETGRETLTREERNLYFIQGERENNCADCKCRIVNSLVFYGCKA